MQAGGFSPRRFPGFFGKVPQGIIRGSAARKSLSWLRKVLIFAITPELWGTEKAAED
jgi:hypothetical protein